MRPVTTVLICISLALCQAQINGPEVTSQTPPVAENGTLLTSEVAINDVLTFGDNVIFIVSERLKSLSPEMRLLGEKILADTRDGIRTCENSLRQNGSIWEYKVCCSSYLRYAMSALAGLVQQSGRSGAARPSLFFM